MKTKATFVDGGGLTCRFPRFSDKLFKTLRANVGPIFERIAGPKLTLKDPFDSRVGLTKVLHNNVCTCEWKFFNEIGEGLPQNVKGTTGPCLVLAGKITLRETAALVFDLR
jgi:hypothetical protein